MAMLIEILGWKQAKPDHYWSQGYIFGTSGYVFRALNYSYD
jgi:hypothetical protein